MAGNKFDSVKARAFSARLLACYRKKVDQYLKLMLRK